VRGRKPNPTWKKILDGNPGKRALNADEPELPAAAATFETLPAELTNPVAIAEWQRLAPILYGARQVTDVDRGALIALCLEWARYQDALKAVTTLVVETPSGYSMPNPYLAVANRAFQNCAKLWPELGLTPSSRSRVKALPDGSGDPFAEFDQPLAVPSRPRAVGRPRRLPS
jgi:P27 family predicted phage terminase small subunit